MIRLSIPLGRPQSEEDKKSWELLLVAKILHNGSLMTENAILLDARLGELSLDTIRECLAEFTKQELIVAVQPIGEPVHYAFREVVQLNISIGKP